MAPLGLSLSQVMKPMHEVRSSTPYPSQRIWTAVDLLLTDETVAARPNCVDQAGEPD